jgi:RecA/RadA recombinase
VELVLMAELFNIQDLLSVNVSLNTNKLFAILQTVTDKLSEQEAYIKLLELRIVDVENRQNSTDFKLIELASVPQVVPAEEEKTIDPEEIKAQIDTHLQTLRQEAAEHDKKIIILEQNMRDAVLDAKSKADKTSMEIQSIHTVIRTDREKITQKVAQIYRELRDDLNRVDADVIENNRFLLVR